MARAGTTTGLAVRAALLAGLSLIGPVALGTDRHQGVHVHGVGTLNVAIDGDVVEMQLRAPGADIVGFEHSPETQGDQTLVTNAVKTLEDGGALFAFPADAGCTLSAAEVGTGLLVQHDRHGEGTTEESGHRHRDEDGAGHAEFLAHYRFECAEIGALTHFTTEYFDRFPAAHSLEVQAITSNDQSAAELTAGANRLTFE